MSEHGVTRDEDDDVLSLDEIIIPGIEKYPETESVLLHGPPGTGKTTTAAARVALLLRDHGYSIGDVAWATYRRSLAEDTLDRLASWGLVSDAELDDPREGATRYISTIHAIANRAVSGLPKPVETGHKIDFCNQEGIRYAQNTPWGTSPGKELFGAFEWLKNNCYDPGDPTDLAAYPQLDKLREQFGGDVGEMWDAWEVYKEGKDRIGFHEQLEAALRENAHPGVPIVVIDEFHDATPLMAKVAEMWMESAEIVIVAGDPHQVVNSYQGASPYFFERLEDRYPKILLDKSWRFGAEVWNAATALLSHAHEPPAVETTGTSDIRKYRSPTFEHSSTGWRTPSASDPGSPVTIIERYGDDDVMLLARTRKQVDGLGATLEESGIIYASQNELGGWNTESGAVRLHLHNALQKIRGYTPTDFETGVREGFKHFERGRAPPKNVWLSAAEAATLLAHVDAGKYLAQSRGDTDRWATGVLGTKKAQSLHDLNELVTPEFWTVYTHGAASETELNKKGRSDRERTALRKALQAGNRPTNPDDIGVSIMTIHASKGHEAADVILYDGIPGSVKTGIRVDEGTRRNEWRTWYVGLTRASDRVHIMERGFPWCKPFIPNNIQQLAIGNTPRVTNDD